MTATFRLVHSHAAVCHTLFKQCEAVESFVTDSDLVRCGRLPRFTCTEFS